MQSNRKFLPIRYLNKRYQISNLLGDGSFGEVYSASAYSETRNEIPAIPKSGIVAIKSMKNKLPNIIDYSYQKEYEFICQVPPSPYLVTVYEIFLDAYNLKCHMVLEYMDNNIYQLMKSRKGKFFDDRTVRNILYQIIMGINHIHNHSFYHRDIKPENILISANDGRVQPGLTKSEYTVKLADFGLARRVDNNSAYTSYVSTRWYRSPEILLRADTYSLPVDIWAFGAVAIEVANLSPLFPGKNEMDQLWRLINTLGNPSNQSDCGEWNMGYSLAERSNIVIPQTPGCRISELFKKPDSNKKLRSMVKGCLLWDPELRFTAKEILRHEYFVTERKRYSRKKIIEKTHNIGMLEACQTKTEKPASKIKSSSKMDPEKRISIGLPALISYTGNNPLAHAVINPPPLRQTPSPVNMAYNAASLAFANSKASFGAITPSPPKCIARLLAKISPQKSPSVGEDQPFMNRSKTNWDICQDYIPNSRLIDEEQYLASMNAIYSDDIETSNLLPIFEKDKSSDVSMINDHIFGSFSPGSEYLLGGDKDLTSNGFDFQYSPARRVGSNFNVNESTGLGLYSNEKWDITKTDLKILTEGVDRFTENRPVDSCGEAIGPAFHSVQYPISGDHSHTAQSPSYFVGSNIPPKIPLISIQNNKNDYSESTHQMEIAMNYLDNYIITDDTAYPLGSPKASKPRHIPAYQGDFVQLTTDTQEREIGHKVDVQEELEGAISRLNECVN